MPDVSPLLLVGLGNPGRQYDANRHNVGFMAIEAMVRRWKLTGPQTKFHGELYSGTVNGEKIIALLPQTYMNESGKSVQAAAAFYKIPPERIIVIHDELDIDLGRLRIKKGGGAGGHNGIRSIDQHLGPNYHRLRLGIGHPGMKEKVHGHVLSDFNSDEMMVIEPILAELAAQLPLLIDFCMVDVQNKLALKWQALRPNKE